MSLVLPSRRVRFPGRVSSVTGPLSVSEETRSAGRRPGGPKRGRGGRRGHARTALTLSASEAESQGANGTVQRWDFQNCSTGMKKFRKWREPLCI